MTRDQNKTIVRRFVEEVFGQHRLDAVDELFARDIVIHFGGMPEPVRGIEAWKQLASGFLTAFPDMEVAVEDTLAEGDTVAGRFSWSGTHQGEFMGIPPTGRRVTSHGIGIYHIADGKIATEWVQEDMAGLLQQLGVIPAPATA